MRQPQSSANRSLSLSTRLAVALSTGLMLLPSAFSQEYGSAPQSLDYATATGAHELEASAEFNILDQVNEFFFFSERNPFEGQVVKTTDPTGKKSAKVLTGPAFKVRRENPNFDFYRYVTFYDVETRRDRIFDLPIQRQECHDNSDYFASYEYSYKIKTEVSAGIEIGSVGLNATVGTERQYRANRSLRAVPGVIAEHTPYFRKDTWYGRTFIQTFNSETGKFAFIRPEQWAANRAWYRRLFPQLARKDYPTPFEVKDVEWTFEVDRQIVRKCSRAEISGSTSIPRQRR